MADTGYVACVERLSLHLGMTSMLEKHSFSPWYCRKMRVSSLELKADGNAVDV